MSTIEEVREAEKRVEKVLEALKRAGAQDPNHLSDEHGRLRTSEVTFSSDSPVQRQASTYDGKRSNSSSQSRMIGTFAE